MPTVDQHLAELQHPRADDVRALRTAVLALDPGITEQVKWNAPSFVVDGVDRVTFRLAPRDLFQVVLHRGTAKRDDAATFVFHDPTGLVRWAAPDRGVLDLTAPGAYAEHRDAVLGLIGRWIRA